MERVEIDGGDLDELIEALERIRAELGMSEKEFAVALVFAGQVNCDRQGLEVCPAPDVTETLN